MKYFCLLIIIYATSCVCAEPVIEELDDNSPLFTYNGVLWKRLFAKLNNISAETESLHEELKDLNHRFDGLSERQHNEANGVAKVTQNLNEIHEDVNKRNPGHTTLKDNNGDEVYSVESTTSIVTIGEEEYQADSMESSTSTAIIGHNDSAALTELMERVPEIRVDAKNRYPWTAILRRLDGSVNFNLNWTDYNEGFGNPKAEFFIGLEALHNITTSGPTHELLVILKNFANETRYAKYDLFEIASETEKYALNKLGSYSGDAGDSLTAHKGIKFSAADQQNDDSDVDDRSDKRCVAKFKGAWWFNSNMYCYKSHLTGPYRTKADYDNFGINWETWEHGLYSLSYAEMLIRQKL